jgi:hypothetical protein
MVVTTLFVLAAVASIVFTSSYKRLWRNALRNGSRVADAETSKTCAPLIEKTVKEVRVAEVVQTPLEESRATQNVSSIELVATPTNIQANIQEERPKTPLTIEQQAPIVAVESTQQKAASAGETKPEPQTTRRTRRKKGTACTRSNRRSRKKLSETQPNTESQPPN